MTDTVQHDAYDEATTVTSDPFGLISRDNRNHRKKQRLILAKTHAESGDRVLEVGCGHGLHAVGYARRFRYCGVDLSESLVEATSDRLSECGLLSGVEDLRPHDAMTLDCYSDNQFQAVVGTAILHHLSEPLRALREWCRVTAPGGSVTLLEPNPLFPKDLVLSAFQPEERHKYKLLPWRLRAILDDLGYGYELSPAIFTPPWPARLATAYDSIDAALAHLPVARWGSQMMLMHVQC